METEFNGLKFEKIDSDIFRAKVIGGWIVKSVEEVCHIVNGMVDDSLDVRVAMCFVPDQKHKWVIREEKSNDK